MVSSFTHVQRWTTGKLLKQLQMRHICAHVPLNPASSVVRAVT